MMYASKIKIDYKPKKISYKREVELPDKLFTLIDITQHLNGDEKFTFKVREQSYVGETLFLIIHGNRYETQEEIDMRIAREKEYNKNYEEFHSKFPRKKTI